MNATEFVKSLSAEQGIALNEMLLAIRTDLQSMYAKAEGELVESHKASVETMSAEIESHKASIEAVTVEKQAASDELKSVYELLGDKPDIVAMKKQKELDEIDQQIAAAQSRKEELMKGG